MSLLIGFLTFILVVNCLFLMLLVLVQLPKKEAGAGLAFGGGATDALFGAGSGNALTKMTKYTASTFLGLSLILAVLNSHRQASSSRSLQEELSRKGAAAPAAAVTPTPGTPPAQQPLQSAAGQTNLSLTINTNAPALGAPAPGTNPAPAVTATPAQPTPPPTNAPAPTPKP